MLREKAKERISCRAESEKERERGISSAAAALPKMRAAEKFARIHHDCYLPYIARASSAAEEMKVQETRELIELAPFYVIYIPAQEVQYFQYS